MLSVFCSPSRYTQGRGATAALGREMVALGLEGPVLLIAGKTVIGRLADTWKLSLDEEGMHHEVHRFAGECSPAEIERVKAVARQCGAHTIVGAGGGKVLDTARAVAADLGLPVVNCPTVASSDAPCSALSVIYTEEGVSLLGTPFPGPLLGLRGRGCVRGSGVGVARNARWVQLSGSASRLVESGQDN
jgi:glycerol dehydrogenase